MPKNLYLILILLLGSFATTAQTTHTDSIAAVEDKEYLEERAKLQHTSADSVANPALFDTSSITVMQPTDARLNDLKKDKDYNYDREVSPSGNIFARFFNWILNKIFSVFRIGTNGGIGQYIFLGLVAILVAWLLYKAEFISGLFQKKSKTTSLAHQVVIENIHELDFDALVAESVENRNYRLMVRLYYLKTLKKLTDKELIAWQPTKTNRTYVDEIADKSKKKEFEALTNKFEYIWYGEFLPTENDILELKSDFQNFIAKV